MTNKTLLELIDGVKRGNSDEFSQVYKEFERLINCYAKKAQGEDSVQELALFLLELLNSIDTVRFSSDMSDSLNRYIAVCLRNKYITISKTQCRYLSESDELFDCCGNIILNEENIFLKNAVALLSERQRTAIIYRYFYGFSDSEIAEKLKISRQAVNKLNRKGLKFLRNYYFE